MGLEGVEEWLVRRYGTRTGHQRGLEGSLELPILHGGLKFYVIIGAIGVAFVSVRSRTSRGFRQIWRVARIAITIGFRCF